MQNASIIRQHFTPSWDMVSSITDEVENIFIARKIPLAEAVVVVLTELLENAVKYSSGNSLAGPQGVGLMVDIIDNKIVVEVANKVASPAHVENIVKHIEKINTSPDPSVPYLERLNELFNAKVHRETRIGLYRIAYESKFKLDFVFRDNMLVVRAERPLP